jgi:hypothetical protein
MDLGKIYVHLLLSQQVVNVYVRQCTSKHTLLSHIWDSQYVTPVGSDRKSTGRALCALEYSRTRDFHVHYKYLKCAQMCRCCLPSRLDRAVILQADNTSHHSIHKIRRKHAPRSSAHDRRGQYRVRLLLHEFDPNRRLSIFARRRSLRRLLRRRYTRVHLYCTYEQATNPIQPHLECAQTTMH